MRSTIVSTGVVLVILLTLALTAGCQKKSRAPVRRAPLPAPLPAPETWAAPIPADLPHLPPSPTYFDVGEAYFDLGDYGKAAQAYETYLKKDSSAANHDLALFRLALTHLLPGSPVRDLPRATGVLQDLVKRFPDTPVRSQAELILSLQGEIDRLRTDVSRRDERIRDLSQELERLKQIDMRRRPNQ